ncbi:hypothetical protein E5288_WYG015111 [Bos mutus]|uniref:Uncharacterized protein n=1 Tax=Bos mutus TaxID=72004 RepID=A0A6B0RIC2_9CETA|nr:hypothetical protein [Bos mutus]
MDMDHPLSICLAIFHQARDGKQRRKPPPVAHQPSTSPTHSANGRNGNSNGGKQRQSPKVEEKAYIHKPSKAGDLSLQMCKPLEYDEEFLHLASGFINDIFSKEKGLISQQCVWSRNGKLPPVPCLKPSELGKQQLCPEKGKSTVEREPGEVILQNDKLPYLVLNPGETRKSMNFDLNNNEWKHCPHIQQMHPKLELKLRKKEKGRAREKSWCQELMDPSLLRQDLSYTSSSGQASESHQLTQGAHTFAVAKEVIFHINSKRKEGKNVVLPRLHNRTPGLEHPHVSLPKARAHSWSQEPTDGPVTTELGTKCKLWNVVVEDVFAPDDRRSYRDKKVRLQQTFLRSVKKGPKSTEASPSDSIPSVPSVCSSPCLESLHWRSENCDTSSGGERSKLTRYIQGLTWTSTSQFFGLTSKPCSDDKVRSYTLAHPLLWVSDPGPRTCQPLPPFPASQDDYAHLLVAGNSATGHCWCLFEDRKSSRKKALSQKGNLSGSQGSPVGLCRVQEQPTGTAQVLSLREPGRCPLAPGQHPRRPGASESRSLVLPQFPELAELTEKPVAAGRKWVRALTTDKL